MTVDSVLLSGVLLIMLIVYLHGDQHLVNPMVSGRTRSEDQMKEVTLETNGGTVTVDLEWDGMRYATEVRVNGVWCHLECMPSEEIEAKYVLDTDPDYSPMSDSKGLTYVMVPFSG